MKIDGNPWKSMKIHKKSMNDYKNPKYNSNVIFTNRLATLYVTMKSSIHRVLEVGGRGGSLWILIKAHIKPIRMCAVCWQNFPHVAFPANLQAATFAADL